MNSRGRLFKLDKNVESPSWHLNNLPKAGLNSDVEMTQLLDTKSYAQCLLQFDKTDSSKVPQTVESPHQREQSWLNQLPKALIKGCLVPTDRCKAPSCTPGHKMTQHAKLTKANISLNSRWRCQTSHQRQSVGRCANGQFAKCRMVKSKGSSGRINSWFNN